MHLHDPSNWLHFRCLLELCHDDHVSPFVLTLRR
jgi:hypothetical protein